MKYFNLFILNFVFLITLFSCVKIEERTIKKNNSSEKISEAIFDEPIDLTIKNIIIYPSQFDKNSIYIDVEISSVNGGYGEVQIALLNDKKLVASNPIKVFSNKQNYFQSFLIGGEVDYKKILKLAFQL